MGEYFAQTVQSGALLLARAGLLAGRRATTHWHYTHVLQERYPQVEVDGDVVTLATPLGDETLWSKRAIAAIEEPPFGSASAHEESGSDVEQTDNDIQNSEQDAAEPHS